MRDEILQQQIYNLMGAFKSGFEENDTLDSVGPHYWILVKPDIDHSKIRDLSDFLDDNFSTIYECYIDAKEPGVIKISFF